MKRVAIFLYGVIAYAIFFVTFCYAIGFVGNILVPKAIDSGAEGSLGQALLINALLLGLFAVQHSVMARPGFKKWWTKIIPEPAERSTFVLLTSFCLITLFTQWQPIGGVIWNVQDTTARTIIYAFFALGWILVLFATFLINHFDLFGLRQVYLYLRGKEYTPVKFNKPVLYKYIRHPLYLGFFIAFWSTPTMTIAHLFFALLTTGYIVVATQLEERDLIKVHGEKYRQYRKEVPMYFPTGTKKQAVPESLQEALS